MKDSPLFTRTHDLLRWILTVTRKFPREQRFLLAQRLCQQAFTFQDALVAAGLDRQQRSQQLLRADIALTNLRKSLLLSFEMELLSSGQYRHVSEMMLEVGKLLGAWRKHEAKG